MPTVQDRIAQTVTVAYLEPLVEQVFHPDSYGYRPGRSPLDAVETCRQRCWRYDWVIDLDIRGFFDNLDHDLILKAVAHHTDHKWILLYVQRWLTAPVAAPDGTLAARDRGSDHEYVSFDFLGYTFKPRSAKAKDGRVFTTFSPAISGKSAKRIRQEIRRMRFHLRSDLSFEDIAKMINMKAGPWATYYGRYRPGETAYVLFHIDRYLVRWARRNYKHLRRAPRRARQTLASIRRSRPGLFAHWRWQLRTRLKAARAG